MEIKNLAQQYIYWPEVDNTYQKNVDFSKVKVSDLNPLFENEINSGKVSIEDTILRFYSLNEILAKLRRQENELLDDNALDLYKQYMQEVEDSSKKLFAYVFFISLIEARHCYELKKIKNIVSVIEDEDYDLTREFEREVSHKYRNVRELNSARFYKQRDETSEKYGDFSSYDDPKREEYSQEMSKIRKRYDKVASRINRIVERATTAYSEKLAETREQRAEESRERRKIEMVKSFMNNNGEGEDISEEKMLQFLEIAKELTKLGSYGRSAVYDKVMPLLEKEEFKDVTIEDMMKCVVNIFKYGSFDSGYGGEPWANITKHGLNFVQGKVNAEVFLDQAFSLEHNNGNMFNKNIIFDNAGSYYWRTYYIDLDNPHYSDSNQYNINNCQFLLNAQHQGQLLSLLSIDTNRLESQIGTKNLLNHLSDHRKTGLIPAKVNDESVSNIDEYINENLYTLKNIGSKFHVRNPQFKNLLKKFKVEIPTFDILSILNNCSSEGDTINFGENHHLFHNLTNYQLAKYSQPKAPEIVKSEDYKFSFDYVNTKEVPQDKLKKEILGNKAFGLAQMNQMDLPVPDAIVFPTTNASGYFNEKAKWINSLRPELNKIKNHFTDSQGNPIACSVRSGSSISMPGMMDTILNVGIDDSNYDYFCKKMGKEVTNECVTKFMALFTKSLFHEEIKFSGSFSKALYQFREVLNRHNVAQSYEGRFPLNARQQYKWCLQAVFGSWHSERAVAYRNHQGISHDIGTAAIVQQMVFGNLNENSCTGVVFSRDCISGDKGIIGEFLPKAQGEDVVSGAVTPKNIKELKEFNPVVYDELITICERLEKDTGDIQDIEFTVEDNKLYILQKRKAVCSSLAQNKLNQELFETGLISEEKMLLSINVDSLITKDIVDTGSQKPEMKGLVGNPGVLRGIVVKNEEDMATYAQLYRDNNRDENFGWIFYAPETSPDHAPIMLKTHGFITSNGGFTSHAAILSRSWDKPCIVGVGDGTNPLLESGSLITMDANSGHIYKNLLPLKEGSQNEVNALVNRILDFHKINMADLSNENSLNQSVVEVNSKKSWMEQYANAVKIENKPIKCDNFLGLGHKIALMLVKAQEDSLKVCKKTILNLENPLKMEVQSELTEPQVLRKNTRFGMF